MDGLYHVVSRVVDRRMIFGEEEKKKFRELLVSYAGFSGITVAAWCLMDNHFHLLLHVPSREQADPACLPEKEILRRLRLIYGKGAMADIKRVLGQCSDAASRARYLERFTKRMGDLAMFMRSLKQRFSRWYNGRNRRKGTLWEDRYRSVAVEIQDLATLRAAARIVSAYIDLNPVRAGMVEDPAEYAWCGFARALVGEKESAKGLLRVWGKQRGLKGALAEYRVYLFEEGSEERVEDRSPPLTPALCPQAGVCRLRLGTPKGRGGANGGVVAGRKRKVQDPRTGEMKTRVGIDARKVWEERKRGGRLPLHVMLRLKSRYLVDGAAIGSAEFLRRLTGGRQKTASLQDSPDRIGARRHKKVKGGLAIKPDSSDVTETDGGGTNLGLSKGKPGVAMRFGQWGGLRVLRDLRVNVVA
jgi:REP element-mobilizing transposase RayT